jgi:hypothetical protein
MVQVNFLVNRMWRHIIELEMKEAFDVKALKSRLSQLIGYVHSIMTSRRSYS